MKTVNDNGSLTDTKYAGNYIYEGNRPAKLVRHLQKPAVAGLRYRSSSTLSLWWVWGSGGANPEKPFFGSIDQMYSITTWILKVMRQNDQKVKGCRSLRTNIIINWLKNHSLRKVQYMAGHRYIVSTEKYLQDDLENLHDIVNNYHPIS